MFRCSENKDCPPDRAIRPAYFRWLFGAASRPHQMQQYDDCRLHVVLAFFLPPADDRPTCPMRVIVNQTEIFSHGRGMASALSDDFSLPARQVVTFHPRDVRSAAQLHGF